MIVKLYRLIDLRHHTRQCYRIIVSISISSPGWWGRPLVRTAWYTDLATGAWHAAWFSIFLACWTFVMVSPE